MLKVAMISKWHVHAEGYARSFNKEADACVTCVWDENPERGREWAKQLEVPFVENYDDVLANFRTQLAAFNSDKLISKKGSADFSDAEFKRVMIHINNHTVYESAKILRDK